MFQLNCEYTTWQLHKYLYPMWEMINNSIADINEYL